MEPGLTVGGKYLLVRRIGVGGMGEVWLARNRTTGAEVAVKMARGVAISEDSALRFRHEARLGAMLAHRSVVRIFDLVEEADGTLLLVMELLRGETLERCMQRRGPLPTREAVAIAVPLLGALAHAHATGIVHRDVTPANIFLAVDPDGHVTPKLLDFGIAKVPGPGPKHTVDGRALGTPRYMAPERIREQGVIDGRSDLFGVGVVLYEMLTGLCPFAASSPAASLAAVLEVVVDPDARIDPRVWIELRQSMSKRPYERQATALAMASGLLAACGETEVSIGDALRREPPRGDLSGDDAVVAEPSRTVDGHSFGAANAASVAGRRRSLAWVLAAFALLTALATVGASAHRRPVPAVAPTPRAEGIPARSAAPSVDTGPAPSIEAIPPAPPQAVVSRPIDATPSSPTAPGRPATVTAPVTSVPAHPARPRPRPVATTPGF